MDTAKQLYEHEATGWKQGLYDDIKCTFRAPIVNWIFRTTMANYPEFVRYAWGQVKPLFQTRQFGRVSVQWRDAMLTAVDSEDTPRYRRQDLSLSPAEFTELRGQLATYDIVGPRLAVLFEVIDRSLSGKPVGTTPADSRAATAPLPAWLDRERGQPPTMAAFSQPPAEIESTVDEIQAFHGLDEGLPSIYRTLAQWPSYLDRLWTDIEPVLQSDGFDSGCADARAIVDEYVESAPYVPQLAPDSLKRQGLDEDAIAALAQLFSDFNTGPIETVVPALPLFADTLGVAGERSFQ